ncbi:hypothetical protein CYMTET_48253 [Cymbomonas tetramitiformis]|uniref:BRCT domain-containing protein n=1 Tax=Cymbomonas tetramitiformis TaxID=36881 RepID=A0AAE0BSM9_9CHLO|nr:hypothetical protein CYMTET_48253 [Cymbomonas tetramitiformis]
MSTTIITTGFSENAEAEVKHIVEKLPFLRQVTKLDDNVQFVVAKSVRATKYRTAISMRKSGVLLEVVSVDWLRACEEAGKFVRSTKYSLKPFTGLHICGTSLEPGDRDRIEKLCAENGGEYSSDLRKAYTTHLVAASTTSDKCKYARDWGSVWVVSPKWFYDCVAEQVYLEESAYWLEVPAEPNEDAPAESSRLAVSASREVLPPAKVEIEEEPINDDMNNENDCPWDSLYLSACRIHLYGFPPLKSCPEARRVHDEICHGGAVRRDELAVATHLVVYKQTGERDLQQLKQLLERITPKPKVVWPSWLHSCRKASKLCPVDDFLVRMFSPSGRCPTRAVQGRRGGHALPRPEMSCSPRHGLHPNTPWTDVHSESADPDADRMVPARNAATSGAPSGPGTEGAKRKAKAPACDASAGARERKALRTAEPPEEPGAREASSRSQPREWQPQLFGVHVASAPHEAAEAMDADAPPATRPAPPTSIEMAEATSLDDMAHLGSGVFRGRCFRLSPLLEEEDRQQALAFIEMGEGTNLDANGHSQGKGGTEVYIVCPAASNTKEALAQCSPGAGPPWESCVTVYWLQNCIPSGVLHEPTGNILYTPLPHVVPMPCMKGVRVCVSQYMDELRSEVERLCHLVGARYSEVFRKKNTHLLCQVLEGNKYDHAASWGTPIVTHKWLQASVKAGKLEPPEPYRPQLPGSDPQEARGEPASAAPIGSQVMATQFPGSRLREHRVIAPTRTEAGDDVEILATRFPDPAPVQPAVPTVHSREPPRVGEAAGRRSPVESPPGVGLPSGAAGNTPKSTQGRKRGKATGGRTGPSHDVGRAATEAASQSRRGPIPRLSLSKAEALMGSQEQGASAEPGPPGPVQSPEAASKAAGEPAAASARSAANARADSSQTAATTELAPAPAPAETASQEGDGLLVDLLEQVTKAAINRKATFGSREVEATGADGTGAGTAELQPDAAERQPSGRGDNKPPEQAEELAASAGGDAGRAGMPLQRVTRQTRASRQAVVELSQPELSEVSIEESQQPQVRYVQETPRSSAGASAGSGGGAEGRVTRGGTQEDTRKTGRDGKLLDRLLDQNPKTKVKRSRKAKETDFAHLL